MTPSFSRSRLRRIQFLLYFFVPVALALAAGAVFDHLAQSHLRQIQESMSQEVDSDIQSAAEAAGVSRELLDVQQRVTQALNEAKLGRIDEAQAYQLHTQIVEQVSRLQKRLSKMDSAHEQAMVQSKLSLALASFLHFREFLVDTNGDVIHKRTAPLTPELRKMLGLNT